MHTECVDVARKVRRPAKEEQCWRCEDETEWGIEKYCEPGRVQYPLVTTLKNALALGSGPASVEDTVPATTHTQVNDDDDDSPNPLNNSAHTTSAGPVANADTSSAFSATTNVALAPASVKDTPSTTMNLQVDDSVKQGRDRARIAKKSAEVRKRAKREYRKLNKKQKKELKKKLEKDLKKLMRARKKLEKRVKGLGGGRKARDNV
ncbi:hypothetical protein B0T09DRAFT_392462 [Sordaria sp. MPI-SDFR-AT-0083]|nr:hypothetical protein B0T09DRAFT_392462 [Sordaria sp. MPI-SDFR-AT-0083]